MEYITSLQAADKWNLSKRQVNALCKSGQIYGAVKKGQRWMIPEDAVYESKRSVEKQPDPIGEKYLNLGNEGKAADQQADQDQNYEYGSHTEQSV